MTNKAFYANKNNCKDVYNNLCNKKSLESRKRRGNSRILEVI